VDSQIDRLQLNAPPPVGPINITGDDQHFPSDRAEHLQSLVKSLSIPSSPLKSTNISLAPKSYYQIKDKI
jgi:hypothetical protein